MQCAPLPALPPVCAQREAVLQGAVLLSNGGGVLPLDLASAASIAVLGPNGGSSDCPADPTQGW